MAMNDNTIVVTRREPPQTSWWAVAPGPTGFTAYVLETQWPRMRGAPSAVMLTGSESGACVSQWRPSRALVQGSCWNE